jgi:hypothetical protein
VFTTSDGMTVTATVFKIGDGDKAEIWAQFTAAGDGAAKPEADELRAKLAGWTYQLGVWKEKALAPSLDELKAAEPAAPAAGAPPLPAPALPAPVPPAPAPPAPAPSAPAQK